MNENTVIDFLVGLIIIMVFIALGMWSSPDFSATIQGLFLMTVMCTAGIGFILWLFVAYVIGYIVMEISRQTIELVKGIKNNSKKGGKINAVNNINKEQTAIINYIEDAKGMGLTEEEILIKLKNAGWSEEQITKAFDVYRNR